MIDSTAILAAYRAAPNAYLQSVMLVEYRCREGCLLLHIWQSPSGAMYYRPAGPLPKGNGLGPNLRLPAHGSLLADFDTSGAGWGWDKPDVDVLGVHFDGLMLTCAHVYGKFSASDFAADALAAKPGKPLVRNDFWHSEPTIPTPRERKAGRRKGADSGPGRV